MANNGKLRGGTCAHVGDYGKIYAVRTRAKQIPRGGEMEVCSERLCRYCELGTLAMVFVWEYFNKVCER